MKLGTKVLAAILVLTGRAMAAPMLVTDSASAPLTPAVSNTPFDATGGLNLRHNQVNKSKIDFAAYGQTFTAATAFTLDAVTVKIHDLAASTSEVGANAQNTVMGLKVFSYNGTTSFTELKSLTGASPTSLTAGHYLRFDLDAADNVALTAGQQYAFLIYFTTSDAAKTRSLLLADKASGTYTGGRTIRRELAKSAAGEPVPELLTTDANRDIVFYLDAAPVPEPGSLMLAAIAAGGLLLRRR